MLRNLRTTHQFVVDCSVVLAPFGGDKAIFEPDDEYSLAPWLQLVNPMGLLNPAFRTQDLMQA